MQEQLICPYPGLRPFNEDESIFFKGRDEHIEQIVKQLEEKKFLMLTGASGDGKSSLVYAGVIPNARAGFFKAKFNNWVVADFRPEREPLTNMANSINEQLKINDVKKVEKELSYGFSSLVDLYKASSYWIDQQSEAFTKLSVDEQKKAKRKGANLLILVDQFEEFFTNPENYIHGKTSLESQTVVNILLETSRLAIEQDIPIYIICTMRSDYIGQCASFRGLPEYIGYSQFFVPRLKRKEIYQVIEEPALLNGNKISKRLVEMLLNEMNDGIDQLPVLQHALNQIWMKAEKGRVEMDLIHFAKINGIPRDHLSKNDQTEFDNWFDALPEFKKGFFANSSLGDVLDAHANELYQTANAGIEGMVSTEDAKLIVKTTFKCLTKIDESRAVRNRMTLEEVTQIINRPHITVKIVSHILYAFRMQGNTFIKPFILDEHSNRDLTNHSVLDITHESLIRNWQKLNYWAKQEHEHYLIWQDFSKQLQRWVESEKSSGYLLPIGPLTFFETNINKININKYWLARYDDREIETATKNKDADEAILAKTEFLNKSHLAIINEQKKKKHLRIASFSALLIVIILLSFFSFWAIKERNKSNDLARISKSDRIAVMSLLKLEQDPTLSLRLAEYAYNLNPIGKLPLRALTSSFNSGTFHNMLEPDKEKQTKSSTNFLSNGNILIGDSLPLVYSISGKKLFEFNLKPHVKWNLALSKNKNQIATYNLEEKVIDVWDISGTKIFHFQHPSSKVTGVSFSNKGDKIVVAGSDGKILIWKKDSIEVFDLKFHFKESKLKFSDDDKTIAALCDSALYYISLEKGKERFQLISVLGRRNLILFSPNNHQILFTDQKATPVLYDINNGKSILLDPKIESSFAKQAFSLNGENIITYTYDKLAIVWNNKGKIIHKMKAHPNWLSVAGFSKDGKFILTAGWNDKIAKLWDSKTMKELFATGEHDAGLREWTKFDEYGKYITTGGWFNSAKIWDFEGNELMNLKGHTGTVFEVLFSPNNRYALTSSYDNTRRIWKIKPKHSFVSNLDGISNIHYAKSGHNLIITTSNSVKIFDSIANFVTEFKINNSHFINSLTSPDGKHIIIVDKNNLCYFIDNQGKLLFTFKTGESPYKNSTIAFSPDGRSFFNLSKDSASSIIQFNCKGDTLLIIHFKDKDLNNLTISDNGKFLLASSMKKKKLWDMKGNLVSEFKEDSPFEDLIDFSPHSNLILCTAGNKLTLRDLKGKILHTFEGHTGNAIYDISFSPNGKYFASCSNDNTARIWDTSGKCVSIINGHSALQESVNFSSDSQHLLTSSYDKTAKIWTLTGELLQEFRGHTNALSNAIYSPNGKYILTCSSTDVRLWPIDPQLILQLINDKTTFGVLRNLTIAEINEYTK